MLWDKAQESIIQTMEKCGEPLTEAQKIVLAGALSVWIEKAFVEGVAAANKGYH